MSSDGCGGYQLRIDAMQWTAGIDGSWFLTIETSGAAVVSTGDKKYRLQLSQDVCTGMVSAVQRQRFFGLRNEYGVGAIDGAMRRLNISLGRKQHSVVLYDDAMTGPDRDAVKRVLSLWVAVRSLFNVPEAEDSRAKDRLFLEQ